MKKNNRKINKYALGGLLLGPLSLTNTYNQLTQPSIDRLDLQLNLKLKPIDVNKAAPTQASSGLNMNTVAGVGGAIGAVGNLLPNMMGTSTATTSGEAVQQSISGVVNGVSTGVQAGMAFGPVGAVVGGAAGLATGLAGKSGKVTSGGFYEDPTMTLGTGLKGAFGNSKLRRQFRAEKDRVMGNRIARQTGSELAQDWAEEYDQDVYTMANGGMLPSNLAYVDDGETINTPDGQILNVPERGQAEDSNLVSLPAGSKILSDKLKVPGTNQTFAEMGKKLMSKKTKVTNKDRFAKNTEKLNSINDQAIHDNLFNIQEGLKTGNQSITKFAKGGKIMDYITSTSNMLGTLAPVFSNLNTTAETVDDVHNPYSSQIASTMAGRRFNTAPARRAIRENRSISNYNASQFNPNTGANMAYRLQSQLNQDNAITDLYSQASNIDNQYASDYANTLNNLGQQYVTSRNYAADLNARNRASARNINRAGLSQVSNYLQNRELMGNQRTNDQAMLDLYAPFLQSGFTGAQVQDFMKQFIR